MDKVLVSRRSLGLRARGAGRWGGWAGSVRVVALAGLTVGLAVGGGLPAVATDGSPTGGFLAVYDNPGVGPDASGAVGGLSLDGWHDDVWGGDWGTPIRVVIEGLGTVYDRGHADREVLRADRHARADLAPPPVASQGGPAGQGSLAASGPHPGP